MDCASSSLVLCSTFDSITGILCRLARWHSRLYWNCLLDHCDIPSCPSDDSIIRFLFTSSGGLSRALLGSLGMASKQKAQHPFGCGRVGGDGISANLYALGVSVDTLGRFSGEESGD